MEGQRVGSFIGLLVGVVIAIFIGVTLFDPVQSEVADANVTAGSSEESALNLIPLLYVIMIVAFVVAAVISVFKFG
jgi:ABC-type antimicrobial peptide transport system permease subunit